MLVLLLFWTMSEKDLIISSPTIRISQEDGCAEHRPAFRHGILFAGTYGEGLVGNGGDLSGYQGFGEGLGGKRG